MVAEDTREGSSQKSLRQALPGKILRETDVAVPAKILPERPLRQSFKDGGVGPGPAPTEDQQSRRSEGKIGPNLGRLAANGDRLRSNLPAMAARFGTNGDRFGTKWATEAPEAAQDGQLSPDLAPVVAAEVIKKRFL